MIRSSNKILGTVNKEMIPKVLRTDALPTEIGSRNKQHSRGCMNEMRDGPCQLRWVGHFPYITMVFFSDIVKIFPFSSKRGQICTNIRISLSAPKMSQREPLIRKIKQSRMKRTLGKTTLNAMHFLLRPLKVRIFLNILQSISSIYLWCCSKCQNII